MYDILGKDVANVRPMLSVLGIPIAAGIAILRATGCTTSTSSSTRALVYGGLTATLAAMYRPAGSGE